MISIMRILFIADGRSSHARNWISYFVARGDDVVLLSTYICEPLNGTHLKILPGLFRLSGHLTEINPEVKSRDSYVNCFLNYLLRSPFVNYVWNQLKIVDFIIQISVVRRSVKRFRPTIVHALRMQNEGYLASFSGFKKFIISSWGSDFIETARNHLLHNIITRIALHKTPVVFSDCFRDIRIATELGLPESSGKFIYPGNGGVRVDIFHPPIVENRCRNIVYSRGISKVTRVDVLFQAFAKIRNNPLNHDVLLIIFAPTSLQQSFRVLASGYGLSGDELRIVDWANAYVLADIMRSSMVFVSPLVADGVPNSMLEAMACGMIPVMSNLESIREHIIDGVNGYLFDPNSVQSLIAAIENALTTPLAKFRDLNIKAISENSEYLACMKRVAEVYENIANNE